MNVLKKLFGKKNTVPEKISAKKICACCGNEIENFLPIPEDIVNNLKKFDVDITAPYEMVSPAECLCPECNSWDRERAYALVMKKILPADKNFKVLDIAPRKCLENFIKNNFPQAEYKTADLFMPDVDYKIDVADMKEISDGEFDFFICSHVLEHVADDLKAMRELKRILSLEGKGIIVVPINLNQAEIDEDPNCTDIAERWRRFGQDDHVRAYSKKGFVERLKQVGFQVTEYDKNFFGAELMAENGLCETSTVYVVSHGVKKIEDVTIKNFEENLELEDKNIIAHSILFDADWYKKNYDLGEYLDAAKHYLTIGWKENKNPSPYFSTAEYLEKNPDVATENLNPLLHFEKFGFKEGRWHDELEKVMPEILKHHPECKSNLNGGLLRIRITNNCNAKCRYCGVRLTMGEEFFHAMEPSWYYELCKPLYEKLHLVLITGGDAFFAKESYNYMMFMSENFPQITLMTESNGIAFNDKFQTLACENLFKTHFSINASNAEVFAKSCWDADDSATAKKMFALMIKNIKSYLTKLESANRISFAPDFSMVINKDNADDILNFAELALELHAGFLVFFFDYTENDMSSEFFSEPETSRPALKTLMELERVLAEKVLIYFRVWIPTKEVENLQQEVESIPLAELKQKYKKFLQLAEGRNILAELEERNKIRRAAGKFELDLVHDFSPTLHLRTDVDKAICSAPWNEIDLSPDGRMDCCCWFEKTRNFNDFIQTDSEGKKFVDWEKTLNSFEYASIRYRILKEDFRGCAVGCPLNSVKNPIASVTKYNLDRLK